MRAGRRVHSSGFNIMEKKIVKRGQVEHLHGLFPFLVTKQWKLLIKGISVLGVPGDWVLAQGLERSYNQVTRIITIITITSISELKFMY